jgi:hypothetical protein
VINVTGNNTVQYFPFAITFRSHIEIAPPVYEVCKALVMCQSMCHGPLGRAGTPIVIEKQAGSLTSFTSNHNPFHVVSPPY